LNSRTIKIF